VNLERRERARLLFWRFRWLELTIAEALDELVDLLEGGDATTPPEGGT
jgi:hypothetical protein